MVPEIPLSVDSPRAQCYLAKNAAAIQVMPDGYGKLRLGTLIRLPDGAVVEVCGEGFDNQTAKVTWGGSTYYVFRDDLQLNLMSAEPYWAVPQFVA